MTIIFQIKTEIDIQLFHVICRILSLSKRFCPSDTKLTISNAKLTYSLKTVILDGPVFTKCYKWRDKNSKYLL